MSDAGTAPCQLLITKSKKPRCHGAAFAVAVQEDTDKGPQAPLPPLSRPGGQWRAAGPRGHSTLPLCLLPVLLRP
ncbi:hypothetical protein DESPIG_02799 [Desulfovibrio piger ATCC 29098]|uniref:Uncharacterized protein n=1 Tax=Desulfovibrio piger ATCC 29098 TaxID=411464 RepID=B6WXH3_9BACT|nr:hypothetical protein DESPIG_02799 [Desulfovibrio piger ATCC 29098]